MKLLFCFGFYFCQLRLSWALHTASIIKVALLFQVPKLHVLKKWMTLICFFTHPFGFYQTFIGILLKKLLTPECFFSWIANSYLFHVLRHFRHDSKIISRKRFKMGLCLCLLGMGLCSACRERRHAKTWATASLDLWN